MIDKLTTFLGPTLSGALCNWCQDWDINWMITSTFGLCCQC